MYAHHTSWVNAPRGWGGAGDDETMEDGSSSPQTPFTPQTPFAGGMDQEYRQERHGLGAAVELASLPSDAACRRPDEAVSATVLKWEQLLRAHPNDPMAFYWQEMIDWCRNRTLLEAQHATLGARDATSPRSAMSGGGAVLWDQEGGPWGPGKRQAQSQLEGDGEMAGDDSAELDLLNRLVKRFRCDDSHSSPAPQSPGTSSLMWEVSPR